MGFKAIRFVTIELFNGQKKNFLWSIIIEDFIAYSVGTTLTFFQSRVSNRIFGEIVSIQSLYYRLLDLGILHLTEKIEVIWSFCDTLKINISITNSIFEKLTIT